MLFKNITIVDENFEVKKNMFIGIKGDTIDYVSDIEPEYDYGETYNGKERLLIPSFYNTHSHLPMSLMRGYGENLPLSKWLNDRIFPFEAHLTDNDIYYGCLLGIAEMLRYGIGCTTEMYIRQAPLGSAFAESGAKATISNCCFCFDDSDYFDLPIYQDTLNTIRNYHGYDNGRVRVEFSLHAEYTSSEKVAKGIAKAAFDNNSSIHVHVSETSSEVAACRERRGGRSPVKYLADCGIFDVPTTAAHCVHIDDNDIEILKSHNVDVSTCPKSNAKLASGICPVTSLLDSGVNVTIGTDSVASNNNLNMIEEMRFFNLLQKAKTYDPTVITPKQTLYCATRAGAVSQRRFDCGLIKEGFKADLTVLDTDKIYMKPEHNILNNLIYSSSGNDVVLTMVNGKTLYKDGVYTTLDTERIAFECEKSRTRILGELSASGAVK